MQSAPARSATAESSPARQTHRSLEEIEFMLDAIVRNEGEPDVVQISGGEPTIHPDFFAILDAARRRPIKHLMVNTNGVRIARDRDFAARLKDYMPGFEVYLQFDSLRDGAAARSARRRSARHAAPGARAPQRAEHLDDARRHAQEGPQRRRDRRDHRLRAAAALRARRDLPADPGRRTPRGLRPRPRPADARRSAPADPAAVVRLPAGRHRARFPATPTASRWPTA